MLYLLLVVQSGSVRLVGNTRRSGRVEIYYDGEWGSVCSSLGINEANVVCRQLGFPAAVSVQHNSQHAQGSEKIWLDNVYCLGSESRLSHCGHRGWGSHSCYGNDVSVECQPAVRLSAAHYGRVEVYHNGTWGAVCDDQVNLNVATTVCKELGYTSAKSFSVKSFYGAHTGMGTVLDDVKCTGNEFSILDCVHLGMRNNNCGHDEDFGVVCNTTLIP